MDAETSLDAVLNVEAIAEAPMDVVPKRINLRNMRLRAFNCCDPKSIADALQRFEFGSFTIRDLRGTTWSNSDATLVIMLKSSKDVKLGVELALALKELGADEINVRYSDTKLFMRFWWD
jgi:hypothetical protein